MVSPRWQVNWLGLFYVFLGTLAFCLASFYNGYPLLYPDSIPYIEGENLPMRAPGYGWITAPLRLLGSIWPYVIFHSLLVSHLIYLVVRTQTRNVRLLPYALLLSLVTVGTSLPWYTGFIMADVFSGVLILALYLALLRQHHLYRLEKVYLYCLIAAACATHLLNSVVAISICTLFIPLRLVGLPRIPWHQIALVSVLILLSVAAVSVNTRVNYGVWAPTAGGYAFPLARLVANGQLKDYLDKHCHEESFAICPYRANLPETAGAFIWHEEIPFKRLGGFLGYRSEGMVLLVRTLSDQPERSVREILDQAQRTMRSFHLQYIFFNQSDTSVDREIQNRFPNEANQFRSARQNVDTLDLSELDKLHRIVVFFSLGASCLLIFLRCIGQLQPERVSLTLIVFVIAALIITCLALGAFAQDTSERYMARVIWLLPAAAFITIFFRHDRGLRATSPCPPRSPSHDDPVNGWIARRPLTES